MVDGSIDMLQSSPAGIDRGDLPPPPPMLRGISLFLDFDGTLVDIAPTPDGVIVSEALIGTLGALADRLPGRMAIVSGRSIAQIDALLGPFAHRIAVAGSHGAEMRVPGADAAPPPPPEVLAQAAREFDAFAARHGLLVERKTLGVALHYRQFPAFELPAAALAGEMAARYGLVLQRGKMMVELRAPGDKGRAVTALLTHPDMAGTRPLFLGDDVTDEEGFAAAAKAGGGGVLVGPMRATAALYRLADVASVLAWARAALERNGS